MSIYSKSVFTEFNSLGLTAQQRERCFVRPGFIRLKVPPVKYQPRMNPHLIIEAKTTK